MNAAASGDYGQLLAALVFLVVGVIAVMNLFGLSRKIAHEVADRMFSGRQAIEALAYRTYRFAGVLSIAIAAWLVVFS